MGELNKSNDDGLSGMSGMTAYNRVDGEFYLHQMPLPDEQVVKQTIQGVVDEFIYTTEQVSLQSILKQNEPVKITETAYIGDTKSVFNKSNTAYSTDSSGNPINRIIIQGGAGSYDETLATNLSASVHDEIIGIAVSDVRPFLIKGLDVDYTAELINDKPSSDGYIKHLTPSGRTLIASIKSPSILTAAGGPSRILVYYDAIDLTGEVIAGTGLTPTQVNARIRPNHVESNQPYLVVKKTIPSGSTLFDILGTYRSLSDILLKPYSSPPPATASDVQLEIVAPGGVIEISTKDFKRPIKSHLLKSHGFDGSFPSPFINIENCVISVKDGVAGYGRPRQIQNTNTPDPTANPSHHIMTISSTIGENLSSYTGDTQTPASLARSTLQVFNILDNEITKDHHFILIAPANPNKYAVLDDFLSVSESTNPPNISIEIALISGRAEEFNTIIGNDGATLEIRGRSNLMDVTDSEVKRNLNLGESIPIKEIGDMGTPTVSITLGGVGQGGADAKAQRTEHESLKGWKDKVVSSGNVSVRNDKQTSTDYASTRALVELPLFPSMFFDVDNLYAESDGLTNGVHAFGKGFEIGIDCTMTAINRVQMQTYEARNSVDWGLNGESTIEIRNHLLLSKAVSPYSFALKAIQPKIQAVVTAGSDLTAGAANSFIQVDSVEAFVNDTLQGSDGIDRNAVTGVLGRSFYVIIGEGSVAPTAHPTLTYCTYHLARIHKIDAALNRLYVDVSFLRYPQNDEALNLSGSAPTATSKIFEGASVVMGGIIANALPAHTANLVVDWEDVNNHKVQLRTAMKGCLGLDYPITDWTGTTEHLGMGCLQWDVFNEWSQDNNRQLKEPIVVKSVATGLKGISQDGTGLTDVAIQNLNLREIAMKSEGSFEKAVDNLIRKINMAGHPDAMEITILDPLGTGGKERSPTSAYNSHLGYVRAFRGSPVESKDGETGGVSIVIHSTVPGATGRNFAVTLSNKSYYPYRPYQAFGHGGLLATNSRSYQLNSFPAPLPLGADGETYVPITTFTGAVHGPISHSHDPANAQRTYDGVGQIAKTYTKTSSVASLAQAYLWHVGHKKFEYIVVDGKAADYRMRSTGGGGVVRINGALASFEDLRINLDATTFDDDEMYLIGVKPYNEPDTFKEGFYQGATELTGIEVEFIYPLMDNEGILFFGGGHTGLVFDIGDGSSNDYSDFYKHPLSKGPTGFSGFQNLGMFGTASAVLDFTDLLNEDTLNEDTLRGFHHKTTFNSNNEPEGCLFYARLTNGLYGADEDISPTSITYTQDATTTREDLFNRKLRLTGTFAGYTNGVTQGVEVSPTGATIFAKLFGLGDVAALFNNNSGTIEAEHGEVKSFNPVGANWCVSSISGQGTGTGPIFHAIHNDGTTVGKPYGLHLGSETATTPPAIGEKKISVAITYPSALPFGSPVLTSVLAPAAVAGGTVVVYGTGFHFIMAGRKDGLSFLYMGHTAGITNPDTGAVEIGIFDYSPYLLNVQDEQYGAGGASPNSRSFFETETSGYAGGAADHPDVPAALQTIRDLDMATIGCALIGAPYVHFPTPITTQGGHPISPLTGYFTELASPLQTYGITAAGDGKNSAGPIHFSNHLSDVALWGRGLAFTEAQTWFASRSVW